MVVRGCGLRVAGGIYAVCPTSPNGKPIEAFLYDPPIPLDPSLGLTPIGVHFQKRPAAHMTDLLVDWVGSTHYQYVADFIEEVRQHGASRRLSSSFDFSQLSNQTRMLFVHSSAIPEHAPELYEEHIHNFWCPTETHDQPGQFRPDGQGVEVCAGLWWRDFASDDTIIEQWDEDDPGERVRRPTPDLGYAVHGIYDGAKSYQPGFFMWLPLHRIEVVRDPVGGTHRKALEATMAAHLPVVLVEE